MNYPKIRNVVSILTVEEQEGQQVLYLHDQERYSDYVIGLPLETFEMIRLFDGKHSYVEIQELYKRQFGSWVSIEQIQQLVEELDQYFLLDSPRFSARLKHLKQEFARLPVRGASHQGEAYPEDRHELSQTLAAYFHDVKGPGGLRPQQHAAPPKAIMAPHIDLKAGGPTFAWAYHALAPTDAEVFVILGTAHAGTKNVLAMTRKIFETPFGQCQTEQQLVEELAEELPYNPFDDELIHKTEHSIEFQLVFLQYFHEKIRRQFRPVPILPILCGGLLPEAIVFNQPVEQVPQLEESVTALKHVLSRHPKACLIASVDFSHIGLRYGDSHAPRQDDLADVEQTDRALLTAMEQVNDHAFEKTLRKRRNHTNVCGIVPMYIMLRLLQGSQGTLLHYDRTEFGKDSYVSFASMVWV